MSSDNNIRIQSELDSKHWMESNPDNFAFLLIQSALDNSLSLPIRQSALLYLKRLVPLYWSPAFDKYVGPNTINQNIKKLLRESLLTLISDSDSKIRSSSAYAIVQIAAVDYPDEWPDLLNYLYNSTINQNSSKYEIIGSLSVLQEIFDDVVTDSQLFEGGVAVQILKTCETLLHTSSYSLDIKVETLRLVKILCQSFENVDLDVPNREEFCNMVVPQIYELLATVSEQLLTNEFYVNQLTIWDLKYELYSILNLLMNSFTHLLEHFSQNSYTIIMKDLSSQQMIYSQLVHSDDPELINSIFVDIDQFYSFQKERKEPFLLLVSTLTKEIEFLQTLIEIRPIETVGEASKILDILLELSILPRSKIEDYNDDFNQFVTDESGLNIEITVRDSAREFLSDINVENNVMFINLLIDKLGNNKTTIMDQIKTESIIFLLACCFDNDDTIVDTPDFDVKEFWMNCIKLTTDSSLLSQDFQFLVARIILMVPKLLFKYLSICKDIGPLSFNQICTILPNLGGASDFLIIKSAILISLQYYNYFVRAKELTVDIQGKLINLVNQLKNDSEEDTNMMLLEVMTIIISINNLQLSHDSNAIELILTIGFKYDSNFTLNTSMFECIEDLLKDIPQQNYENLISFVFPFLLNKITEFNGEYNSHIDLSLQVLSTFLKSQMTHLIPQTLFNSSFSVINKFIYVCDDDELLQSSSEALIELVKMSNDFAFKYVDSESHESGVQLLLKNVSKLLSPSMSDRAIVKLGDLITILLENFTHSIEEYLEDILKALTVRLVKASEVPTIENMILIFNMLTVSQPSSTIEFLKSFQIDETTALYKILPIWFQAFEVMRGYKSILSNVHAFIEIYRLGDETIKQMMVDGDPLPHQVADGVIITRSMAKRMPIKYERIPADAKIIKLLVEELKNEMVSTKNVTQITQVHNEHGNDNNNDDGDDGWEDLEDLEEPSFDQLKNYVDDDSTKRGCDGRDDDMKQLLVAFFKECMSQNTSNFENIYNRYLTNVEKNLLSEYLVFS
jgi:hypothetical protein